MSIPTSVRIVLLLAAGLAAAGCSDGREPAGVPESVDPADAAAELEAASRPGGAEPGEEAADEGR